MMALDLNKIAIKRLPLGRRAVGTPILHIAAIVALDYNTPPVITGISGHILMRAAGVHCNYRCQQ
jgi:hypothetical protein